MHDFKDSNGKQWNVLLDVPKGFTVRQQLGIDLFHHEVFDAIASPAVCAEVAYWLVKEQCEARNMTREDFWSGFDGDTLHDCVAAVWGAVSDFFPKEVRETLRVGLKQRRKQLKQAAKQMEKAIRTSGDISDESLPLPELT